jgi:hypothetical protein
MKPIPPYQQALKILDDLHKAFPTYNVGRHLSTALYEYKDIWGMTDREMVYALSKYKAELMQDVPHPDESEIDKIIKDGMNLDTILDDQDFTD